MQQHLKDQLVELRQCLEALPTDIPVPRAMESKYKFSDFSPDAEWAADIGEAGAVNRELEIRFGNRVDGLKLIERGPETEAVVDVLETWIKKCPGDIILEKWVDDILKAAQGVILAAGQALPSANGAKPSKKKKSKTVEPDVSVMHLYTDAERVPAKGKGGAKVDPLMDLLSVNTYLKSDPKKMIVRCAGAAYGCATTWAAPRWKTRVFGHALQCGKLDKIDSTLRDCVRTAMSKESLGGRVEGQSLPVPSVECEPVDVTPTSSMVSLRGTPSALLKQKSIYPSQRKARIAALKDQLDFDVLKLICIGGIPPTKVDSKEWKTMWKHGNPD
ncbi:hypothetical protein EV424DRAFT_1598569 [Suillus variegatus]|nr:hypothetical protein EV424DRAFT_1598569 [Suillus variegatus]